MSGRATQYLFIGLLTIISCCTAASTEIYKWVDADGNVHFGDKPQEPAQADRAKPVELTTGYQPQARSAEEQEAFEREQRLILEKSKSDRDRVEQRQREDLEDAHAKSQEEKFALCAAYEKEIERLSTTKIVNGRRQRSYIAGEDGKSITAKRQKEIVEELKAEMAKANC